MDAFPQQAQQRASSMFETDGDVETGTKGEKIEIKKDSPAGELYAKIQSGELPNSMTYFNLPGIGDLRLNNIQDPKE